MGGLLVELGDVDDGMFPRSPSLLAGRRRWERDDANWRLGVLDLVQARIAANVVLVVELFDLGHHSVVRSLATAAAAVVVVAVICDGGADGGSGGQVRRRARGGGRDGIVGARGDAVRAVEGHGRDRREELHAASGRLDSGRDGVCAIAVV